MVFDSMLARADSTLARADSMPVRADSTTDLSTSLCLHLSIGCAVVLGDLPARTVAAATASQIVNIYTLFSLGCSIRGVLQVAYKPSLSSSYP